MTPSPAPALRVSIVALLCAVLAATALVLARHSNFLDLHVYRWAGETLLSGSQLYDLADPANGLRFTYTPFAGLLFAALAPIWMLAPATWSVLSLLAAGRACWLVARAAATSWSPAVAAMLVLALTLATEPAVETLRLGQIDFIILWLVVEDLLGAGARRRAAGVLLGIAIGIKLTPAIFLALLVLTARGRAAVVAAATFAATIAIGFAMVPAESRAYWGGDGFDATRVGAAEFVGNQSINGMLWRVLGDGGSQVGWLALGGALAGACLLLARAYWRAGSGTAAGALGPLGLAALAGLFISPVSWTHHWVLVMPLFAALIPLATRSHRPRVALGVLAGCLLVLCSRIIWRVPHGAGLEFSHAPAQAIAAAAYLLVGIALLAIAIVLRPRRV